MEFRDFILEGEATEETKRRVYEKATTIGIPVRRGVRPKQVNKDYSHDPGDFGRGVYYSTDYHQAKSYGEVTKSIIRFKNPLVLTGTEAYDLTHRFRILHLPDEVLMQNRDPDARAKLRLKNAQALTDYLLGQDHDGLIVIYKQGHLEIVDYRPYQQ